MQQCICIFLIKLGYHAELSVNYSTVLSHKSGKVEKFDLAAKIVEHFLRENESKSRMSFPRLACSRLINQIPLEHFPHWAAVRIQ